MTRAWSLAVASVLVPLSLLAGPIQPPGGEASPPGLAEIAGTYYLGDGLGVNLTLVVAPDGAFSFRLQGCLGTYARAEGRVSIHDGELWLETERKDSEFLHFLPFRWGDRLYLIPSDELHDFANAIDRGTEPRSDAHGLFYLREDDWDKPVDGPPDLHVDDPADSPSKRSNPAAVDSPQRSH
jgi:hypothetical protein